MILNVATPNQDGLQTTSMPAIKHNCKFKPYGDVEKICTICNYVIWVDNSKSDYQILDFMIKNGYGRPKCDKNI